MGYFVLIENVLVLSCYYFTCGEWPRPWPWTSVSLFFVSVAWFINGGMNFAAITASEQLYVCNAPPDCYIFIMWFGYTVHFCRKSTIKLMHYYRLTVFHIAVLFSFFSIDWLRIPIESFTAVQFNVVLEYYWINFIYLQSH